ncbi:MAG: isochorismatase family protein [Gammaproteobacteria bacterium]|nr:isochorismatase family protein [Gammaproteobacteria bacterium]MBL4729379.1 isochorismatase family protein [Gammaproteobacteria bacterium]
MQSTTGLLVIDMQVCAFDGQTYAKDTHGWEIHPRMKIGDEDKIVYKAQSNAFENTKLQQVLSSLLSPA